MNPRKIQQIVPAMELSEGAGVRVRRTIGTGPRRHLDPFLMLDHFSSDNPGDYIAGFPDHPHRGFVTLTYMIEGHMLHQDSMGNRGDLRAGGVQWMKAASGIIHSEMPQQTAGLMRGFQLWINLPAAEKMSDPLYRDFPAPSLPMSEAPGVRVKVVAGDYAGLQGAVQDPLTGLHYLDVELQPEAGLAAAVAPVMQAFVYVYAGDVRIAGTGVGIHRLVVLGDGDAVEVGAGHTGARLIVVAGRPLHEPIVQYGPFVMNSEDEIRRALEDFQHGRLVQKKAGQLPV